MTAVVKSDKTTGLDRNGHQNCLRLQCTLLIRKIRLNKVLSFVVMIMVCVTGLKISTDVVYEIMAVCMCVKQKTDDLYA